MNLAKAELEVMSTVVRECELYFGAGDPEAPLGSTKKNTGPDFFTIIAKFLEVFRSVWDEVHSNRQWAAYLPEGHSNSPAKSARVATAGGKPARRASCPGKPEAAVL